MQVYRAALVGVGRMGAFIDLAQSASDHSDISAAVARFADHVPAIAREHGGHCLFNGGEDLMVLFPLSEVIAGVRALSSDFGLCMAEIVERSLLTARLRAAPKPAGSPRDAAGG